MSLGDRFDKKEKQERKQERKPLRRKLPHFLHGGKAGDTFVAELEATLESWESVSYL